MIGSNVGSPVRYETINIVRRGANYGYPLREGPEFKPESPITGPPSADNTLPVRISDTVVLDKRVPMQDSALAYKTGVEGLAIANGFVYRGKKMASASRSPLFLATSPAAGCFMPGWRISLPPRTATPRRWRWHSEITTTLRPLVEERVRLNPNPPPPGFGAGRPGGPGRAGDPAAAPPAEGRRRDVQVSLAQATGWTGAGPAGPPANAARIAHRYRRGRRDLDPDEGRRLHSSSHEHPATPVTRKK